MNAPTEQGGIFAEVARVYRESRKDHDIAWNVYVARPIAAVLVAILRRTPITPNQVTILGALVFVGCAATLVFWRDWTGLLVSAAILELAYVFDKADGQLARLKGLTSDVGAYFDFLIDEVKALLLVGSMSIRVWLDTGEAVWLLVGIGGAALVSIATSLTSFVRRREYAGEEIRPGASARQPSMPEGFVAKIAWLVKRTASFVVHYPSWFVFLALAGAIDGFEPARWFLYLFLGVYALYAARTGLAVVLKLGRPSFYE
jgi:phosphatidylglycerophosphate synthase